MQIVCNKHEAIILVQLFIDCIAIHQLFVGWLRLHVCETLLDGNRLIPNQSTLIGFGDTPTLTLLSVSPFITGVFMLHSLMVEE